MKTSKPSNRTVAYHEAGHIVAACRLLRGIKEAALGHHKSSKVEAAGFVIFRGAFSHHEGGKRAIPVKAPARLAEHGFRDIVVKLAGPMAHARLTKKGFDNVLDVWGRVDREQARTVACHITTGICYASFLGNRILLLSDEAQAVMERANVYARELVRDDWSLIEAVAKKLMASSLKHNDALLARIERIQNPIWGA